MADGITEFQLFEKLTTYFDKFETKVDEKLAAIQKDVLMSRNLLTGNSHPEEGLLMVVRDMQGKLDSLVQCQEQYNNRFDVLEEQVNAHHAEAARDRQRVQKTKDRAWEVVKPILVQIVLSVLTAGGTAAVMVKVISMALTPQ